MVAAATAFSVWLISGILAALFNVPNFGARLQGQQCPSCLPTVMLGPFDYRILVGGLLLSTWLVVATTAFIIVSLGMLRPRQMRRFSRAHTLRLKRATAFGIVVAMILVTGLLADYMASASNLATDSAPDFTFALPNGSQTNLHSFLGRPILLEFMHPECGSCEMMVPVLNKVYSELGPEVMIVSISTDREEDALQSLKEFQQQNEVTWAIGLDEDGKGTSLYDVAYVPIIFIIDREGMITQTYRDTLPSAEELLEQLHELTL